MKKINKTFAFIVAISLILNITHNSFVNAQDANSEEITLENEKFMIVDNTDSADEMYRYIDAWDSVSDDLSNEYPHQIKFITNNDINTEQIKEILSKYDYQYLFSYGLTHDFTIDNLRCFFENVGFDFKSYHWTKETFYNYKEGDDIPYTHYKWNFKEKYHRYGGKASGYVNIIKKLLSTRDAEYFVTGLNGFEYDSYEFKINTVAAQLNYCNEEKEYMLRLKNKSEFENLINELTEKNIFIKYTNTIDVESKQPIITSNEYNKIPDSENLILPGRVFIQTPDGNWNWCSLNIKIDNPYRWASWGSTAEDYVSVELDPNDPRINNSSLLMKLKWFSDYPSILLEMCDEGEMGFPAYDDVPTYPEYLDEICEGKIIYRLYNIETGEHLFTSSRGEYHKLSINTNGFYSNWYPEGATCIINYEDEDEYKPVYRIYNPNAVGGDHHYTTSKNEAIKRVNEGWEWDNNGKPIFYSGGDVSLYRLYNKNDGRHHFTPSVNEKNKLVKLGWEDEGTSWNASSPYK